MTTLITGPVIPLTIPREDEGRARESSAAIAGFAAQGSAPLKLRLENGTTGQEIETEVPAGAIRVLAEALGQMARGRPVTLVPLDAELSTQQAAEIMGVSRPYFVKLLEEGKLPHRKVGEQRRVRFEDLQHYLAAERETRHAVLDELTAESQRLGL